MSKSLSEFTAWARAKGVVANPNGSYPGQCVSLIQQYLNQCYDVPYKARGNAKDFIPPKFHQVSGGYAPGDIIRYGRNMGGGYGHIGMIDENGHWLDQNGVRRRAVGTASRPFGGYNAIFRPDNAVAVSRPAQTSNAGIPAGAVRQVATFRATVDRNIRRSPSLNGEIAGTFTNGATQRYDCYIDADGFRWVSWIGASGHRNYCAEKRLRDGKRYGVCY